ncbi:MAG: hypothetical protein KF691_03785 [Phycisphaeraceae bacterium]|nr:hypothetical protein [Phycisphaeraceae bacterium]
MREQENLFQNRAFKFGIWIRRTSRSDPRANRATALKRVRKSAVSAGMGKLKSSVDHGLEHGLDHGSAQVLQTSGGQTREAYLAWMPRTPMSIGASRGLVTNKTR